MPGIGGQGRDFFGYGTIPIGKPDNGAALHCQRDVPGGRLGFHAFVMTPLGGFPGSGRGYVSGAPFVLPVIDQQLHLIQSVYAVFAVYLVLGLVNVPFQGLLDAFVTIAVRGVQAFCYDIVRQYFAYDVIGSLIIEIGIDVSADQRILVDAVIIWVGIDCFQ